jgi:hypothetical protein
MRYNGRKKASRESDEAWSEILGALGLLGFDCYNELGLPIIHCINKKISVAKANLCFSFLSRRRK